MKLLIILFFLLSSCAINEKYRFKKDEYQTFTKNYSYRLIKEKTLLDYITGGVEEPSIYCELGQFDKSLDYFRTNYTRFNNKPAYWIKAAACAHREGKEDLSLFLFKKAKELFPDEKNVTLESNLATYFHTLKSYSLAYQHYLYAMKLSGDNLMLKVNFSRLLIKIGHLEEAFDLLRGIYQVAAYDVEVLHLLGTTLLLLGKYDHAINTYEQIETNDIQRRDIAINYALANYFYGKSSRAISILDNSDKSLNPELEKHFQRIRSNIKS